MPESPGQSGSATVSETRSRGAWALLKIILLGETVVGLWVVWRTLVTILAEPEAPLGMRVSVIAAAIIAWAWIAIAALGTLRGTPAWVRGSALTIHVLMFAAAVGILQGILGTPMLGSIVLIVALAGFLAAVLARPPANAEAAQGDDAR